MAEDVLREALRALLPGEHDALIETLEQRMRPISLKAGETLYRRGGEADAVAVLLTGRLAATVGEGDGRVFLGEVARGETVGELAMITGERRGADVMALRDSTLMELPLADFRDIVMTRPEASMAVMRTVVERFRRAQSSRTTPRRPVNLYVGPVSDGVDTTAFCEALLARIEAHVRPVRMVRRADVPADASTMESFAAWLREQERRFASLILVCETGDADWARLCVRHADEVVLLADGAADPAPAPRLHARQALEELRREAHGPSANVTLVLQHDAGARAPSGTARWLDTVSPDRHLHLRHGSCEDMARIARFVTGRAIGLVLAGGGARGFAHLGVIAVLREAGVQVDLVGGTSIGAIMGSLIAHDLDADGLKLAMDEIFVRHGSPTGDFNPVPVVSFIKGERARKAARRTVGRFGDDGMGLEDIWKPFFCVAANYDTGEAAVLARGSAEEALLASFAIPGALPPIVIDGHLHVDGGTVNNLPVDEMEAMGVGSIVAVDLMSDHVRTRDFERVPSSGRLLADRLRGRKGRRYKVPGVIEILFNSATLHSMGHQRRMRERADLCIRPDLRGVKLLEWKAIERASAAGAEAARRSLAQAEPDVMARLRGEA